MDEMNGFMTHASSGAAVVWAIEKLKQWTGFSLLNADTKRLNVAVSALAAAAIAFGITVSGDATSGWTIGIPPMAALLTAALDWLHQIAAQELIYRGFWNKQRLEVIVSPSSLS